MSRDWKVAAVVAVLFIGAVGGALLYKGLWLSSFSLEQLTHLGQGPPTGMAPFPEDGNAEQEENETTPEPPVFKLPESPVRPLASQQAVAENTPSETPETHFDPKIRPVSGSGPAAGDIAPILPGDLPPGPEPKSAAAPEPKEESKSESKPGDAGPTAPSLKPSKKSEQEKPAETSEEKGPEALEKPQLPKEEPSTKEPEPVKPVLPVEDKPAGAAEVNEPMAPSLAPSKPEKMDGVGVLHEEEPPPPSPISRPRAPQPDLTLPDETKTEKEPASAEPASKQAAEPPPVIARPSLTSSPKESEAKKPSEPEPPAPPKIAGSVPETKPEKVESPAVRVPEVPEDRPAGKLALPNGPAVPPSLALPAEEEAAPQPMETPRPVEAPQQVEAPRSVEEPRTVAASPVMESRPAAEPQLEVDVSFNSQPSTKPAAPKEKTAGAASLGLPVGVGAERPVIPAPPSKRPIAAAGKPSAVIAAPLRVPAPAMDETADDEPRRIDEEQLEGKSDKPPVIARSDQPLPELTTIGARSVAAEPVPQTPKQPEYAVVPIKRPSAEQYAPVVRRTPDPSVDAPQVKVHTFAVKTYVVLAGDTYDQVARTLFGTPELGPALLYFNRSQAYRDEPLTAGSRIRYTDAEELERQFSRLSPSQAEQLRRYSQPKSEQLAAKPVIEQTAASTTRRSTVYAPPTGEAQPIATAQPVTAPRQPRTYSVGESEPLYAIARKTLGSGSRWREIADLNRDVLPPNTLVAPEGVVLQLPDDQ